MKYSKLKRCKDIRGVKFTFLLLFTTVLICGVTYQNTPPMVITGAERTNIYLPLLKKKRIGVVANNSSVLRAESHYVNLVDTLLGLSIDVKKIFAPEHGFRGDRDAGKKIDNYIDPKTGLPVISLYGKNYKPTTEQLKDLDVLVFDLQDVGVRYYTYLSTLHYVMEAAAENAIPIIVLDRPNPNGHYVDGPVLNLNYKSFVGMHPVPIVYGMTIGEYAKMINGEGWMKNNEKCTLTVVPLENYSRIQKFKLPISPSPNLPNQRAVNLYPSLCLFEGTNVNAGRGTEKQFQVYGSPYLRDQPYKYIPLSRPGAVKPKHLGEECYGRDLSKTPYLSQIKLKWIVEAYSKTSDKDKFFNPFFNRLAGDKTLQQQLKQGVSINSIRMSWKEKLENFKTVRSKYLIYSLED